MHERPPRSSSFGARDGIHELIRDAIFFLDSYARRVIIGVAVGRVLVPRGPVNVAKDEMQPHELVWAITRKIELESLHVSALVEQICVIHGRCRRYAIRRKATGEFLERRLAAHV